MTNVRFELGEDVLIARYNKAPEIIFKNNLTIKRGEVFNPLNFVKEVKDDHDNLNKKKDVYALYENYLPDTYNE